MGLYRQNTWTLCFKEHQNALCFSGLLALKLSTVYASVLLQNQSLADTQSLFVMVKMDQKFKYPGLHIFSHILFNKNLQLASGLWLRCTYSLITFI